MLTPELSACFCCFLLGLLFDPEDEGCYVPLRYWNLYELQNMTTPHNHHHGNLNPAQHYICFVILLINILTNLTC
jgi:hypothetical protein